MEDLKKNRQIDELAVLAVGNEDILEQFISKEKAYILSCAGKTLSRHIYSGSEEELIAIEAFAEAVSSYSFDKGSFLSFAKMVITRRLIDKIRKEKSDEHIVPMDPIELAVKQEISGSISRYETEESEERTAFEVESLSRVLELYGFPFSDLVTCSPKAVKTKEACRTIVLYISDNKLVMNEIRRTKMLPINIIEKNTGIPRKIIERHRKYIIAVSEILNDEYPCLAQYVNSMRR